MYIHQHIVFLAKIHNKYFSKRFNFWKVFNTQYNAMWWHPSLPPSSDTQYPVNPRRSLTPISYIAAVRFVDGGKRLTRRKSLNYITWADKTSNYQRNYHIMSTMAPVITWNYGDNCSIAGFAVAICVYLGKNNSIWILNWLLSRTTLESKHRHGTSVVD